MTVTPFAVGSRVLVMQHQYGGVVGELIKIGRFYVTVRLDDGRVLSHVHPSSLVRPPIGSTVTLASGHVVLGEPQDTDEYRRTAADLGYGDDTAAMCRDHDPLHVRLALWIGLPESLSMRCAAGLREPDEVSDAEEAAVLAVQRYARLAGGRLPL